MQPDHKEAGYESFSLTIPEIRAKDALAKLQRLSDRAVKLGMPAFDISVGQPEVRRYRLEGRLVHASMVPISVIGGPPKIPGWHFVAKIEHEPGANEVLGFGAQALVERDPKMFEWLTRCEPDCQHCNFKRNRNVTYLFKSESDPANTMQVGSSCIDDFSGHKSPEDLLRQANQFVAIMDELLDEGEMKLGGSGNLLVDMKEILTVASAVVRHDGGWVSRDNAGPSGCTVDWITQVMGDSKSRNKLVKGGDERSAEEIMDWLTSDAFEVGTDIYRSNLKIMAERGYVKPKAIGLAGSAVATYAREKQRIERAQKQNAQFESVTIGQPDEKIQRKAQLEKKVAIDTDFGVSVLHIFRDCETNAKMTWFNSGRGKFIEGDEYTITGRVKKHQTRNGLQETQLTRVNAPDLALHNKLDPGMDEAAFLKKLKKLDSINARDGSGENLLHIASHQYRFYETGRKIIGELLDRGGDPGVVSNRDGNNAFDYWVDAQDKELIALGLEQFPHLTLRWDDQTLQDYGFDDAEWIDQFRSVRDAVKAEQAAQQENEANSQGGDDDKQSVASVLAESRGGKPTVSEELDLDLDTEEDEDQLRLA